MKCPSCNGNVGLFNPSLRRGKCPHCGALVRQQLRHKRAFLICLGAAFVPVVLSVAVPGLWGHVLVLAGAAFAATVGLLALTKFELRTVGP
jgi:hypothetical protein